MSPPVACTQRWWGSIIGCSCLFRCDPGAAIPGRGGRDTMLAGGRNPEIDTRGLGRRVLGGCRGNRALGATDVNGLTDAVHHHMDDLVITRGQPGLARGQPLVVTDLDQGVGVALRRGGRVRNVLGQRTGRGEVLDQPAKRGAVQRAEPTIEADPPSQRSRMCSSPAAEPGSSGSAGSGPSGSSSSVAAWVLRASTSNRISRRAIPAGAVRKPTRAVRRCSPAPLAHCRRRPVSCVDSLALP